MGEISASTVGLSHRWIIKSMLVAGLITATIAGVAVWLQVALLMWGKKAKRFKLMTLDWPEEVGQDRGQGAHRARRDAGMQAPPVVAGAAAAAPAGAPAMKPAE